VVDTFGDILSDTEKSIGLEISPAMSEDSLTVNGHEGRLAQVITNLVDNAISFSPEGGTVLVRARRLDGFVEFCIEDDGPGIDPENLEQIFRRFYTYRPTAESSRGNNSGLGLSISREIVLAHGGDIWAENRMTAGADASQAPLGARFTVRLPAAPSNCGPLQRMHGNRVGARA